jgi:hypothetical protein
MAVTRVGATAIDHALDRIADFVAAPTRDLPEQLHAALTCAALWRLVFEHAMTKGDAQLAGIAARERKHAHDTYLALAQLTGASEQGGGPSSPPEGRVTRPAPLTPPPMT